MSERRGRLIVVSAPSGAGKGTVLGELRRLRPEIAYSVSATTRAPRGGEEHGRDYWFLTPGEFEELERRGEFLESESYVGCRYGTPLRPIERNVENGIDTILEIEVKGARAVKRKKPGALMIFIMPPSTEELRRRLSGRGTCSEEELDERLRVAEDELAAAPEYDYIIVNDEAHRAARELLEIIDGAKQANIETKYRAYRKES